MNSIDQFLDEIEFGFLDEGRVDNAYKKYSFIEPQIIDIISKLDPSGQKNKYLDWMIKQYLVHRGYDSDINYNAGNNQGYIYNITPDTDGAEFLIEEINKEIVPAIKMFERNIQNLEEKDINKYETIADLESAITMTGRGSNNVTITNNAGFDFSGTVPLYEDNNFFLIGIQNHEASQRWGAGTKWCITMTSDHYWNDYINNESYGFCFLYCKNLPSSNNFSKVAMRVKQNGELEDLWDTKDNPHDPENLFIKFDNTPKYNKLIEINNEKINDLAYKFKTLAENHVENNPPEAGVNCRAFEDIANKYGNYSFLEVNVICDEGISADVGFNINLEDVFTLTPEVNKEGSEKLIKKMVRDEIDNADFNLSISDIEVSIGNWQDVTVRVYFSVDYESLNDEDSFKDFCVETVSEENDKVKTFLFSLEQRLAEHGFVKNHYMDTINKLQNNIALFKAFDLDDGESWELQLNEAHSYLIINTKGLKLPISTAAYGAYHVIGVIRQNWNKVNVQIADYVRDVIKQQTRQLQLAGTLQQGDIEKIEDIISEVDTISNLDILDLRSKEIFNTKTQTLEGNKIFIYLYKPLSQKNSHLMKYQYYILRVMDSHMDEILDLAQDTISKILIRQFIR